MSDRIHKARGLERDFLILRNKEAQRKDLSYEALGMLVYLMSLPPDWVIAVDSLKREGAGRDKVRRIISELETAGFLYVIQSHDEKGQFTNNEYEAYAMPELNPHLSPLTEKPLTDSPSTENPPLKRKEEREKEKKESVPRQKDLLFEAVSLHLFKLDYANETHRADIKANQGRIAKISNYLKEKDATVESFLAYIRDYKKRNPDIDLPLDLAKFSKSFNDFLTRKDKAQQNGTSGESKKGSFGKGFIPQTTPESQLKGQK